MSIRDITASSQTAAIAFECDLPHAPGKVWRALTDPALVAEWLLPAVGFRLESGTAFTLHSAPHPGWNGIVECRMIEADAPRTLRYSWAVPDMDLDTVVTFTLEPTAAGTRLSIGQSGFKPAQKQNWGGARYGWKMMGGKLEEVLARVS